MAGKIYFVLGFHNHQPVGNFDFVIKEAYEKSYLPFIEVLEKFPFMKVSLHYTGILWNWFLENEPDFMKRLKKLVKNKQVELLSGGYYEPIMSVIPEYTRKWQIEKMNNFLKTHFGIEPNGMWLAERVWEPQLVKDIARAGLKYTITDDSHFKCSGLSEEDTHGYYISEDGDEVIYIFPISEKLRYTIPFKEPEATIDFFKSIRRNNEDLVLVMADDGEKFGVWPGTYERVYEEKWLESFFETLYKNQDWIIPVTFSEALNMVKPKGKVFLPTASYKEMMEWAMPTNAILKYEELTHILQEKNIYEKYKEFIRGGFWRNFISKYEETNNLHKKMLSVFKYFLKIISLSPIEIKQLEKAKDYLLQSQCNCGYWHGIFGGLYLNFLRNAIYENLIKCENILNTIYYRNKNWLTIEEVDFLKNGSKEIIVKNKFLNCYIEPSKGGRIFELDFIPAGFNLINTMTRRPEAYHKKIKDAIYIEDFEKMKNEKGEIKSIHDLVIVKERNLSDYLIYDEYRKVSFIDHFLKEDISLKKIKRNNLEHLIKIFSKEYQYSILSEEIQLKYKEPNFSIQKSYLFSSEKSSFTTNVKVKSEITGYYAMEFNFGLMAENAPDRFILINNSEERYPFNVEKEEDEVSKLTFVDKFIGYRLSLLVKPASKMVISPIYTVSLSESGGEKNYQNTNIFLRWEIEKNKSKTIKIITEVELL